MLRDTKDLSVLGSIDAGVDHGLPGYLFSVPPRAETTPVRLTPADGAGYSEEMRPDPASVDFLVEPVEGWRTWNLSADGAGDPLRSEEHTSELQSRPHLVCRLLLEK